MRRRAGRARSIRSLRWSSLYVILVFLEVACSADVKRPGEKRVEEQWIRWRRQSNFLCRRISELVGCTDKKIRENQAAVQRRPRQNFGLASLY